MTGSQCVWEGRGGRGTLTFACYIDLHRFLFDFTAAGVVQCGGRKTPPRTSTIVQFIFYFGPLRSAIIF